MDKYPEHEKLEQVRAENVAVSDFMEWMNERGYVICEPVPTGRSYGHDYLPIGISPEKMLAEFFDIDLQKLEQEKRAMLSQIRQENIASVEGHTNG